MVYFFISGDAGVYWDPVDLSWNAVGEEDPRPAVDPPHQSLSWAWLQVCRLSNMRPVSCSRLPLGLLHSAAMYNSTPSPRPGPVWSHTVWCPKPPYVQCPESYGGTSIDFVSAHCSGSQSDIFGGGSICPPHRDPCSDFGFCLSCVAQRGSFGCSGVFQ